MSDRLSPTTPAPAFVDLHLHSTASDGACPPVDVVRTAAAAGLAAICLTDHDTLDGLPGAIAAGQALGVRVIPGVELSAMDGGREVHVLGLHLARTEELESALVSFRAARTRRAARIVDQLNRLGVPITLEAVLAVAAGGAVGRPHIARVLIEARLAQSTREAFDRYLGTGRPAYIPKEPLSLERAIALAHGGGGLAIIAHPGADASREWVERLARIGLDGMEVRHPGHSAEDIVRIGALVEHFHMVPSGGSDWHGATRGPRAMGSMGVPASWLEWQEERVAQRAAEALVA